MVSTNPTKTFSHFSCSVYTSVPFEFIVEGESLYIHRDVVSLHSKPLDRMMNGHMEEAQKGSATPKEVDKDTFTRFIEWSYKEYYTAAEFTIVAEDGSDSAGLCTEDERVAEEPVQTTNIPAVEDGALMPRNEPDIPFNPFNQVVEEEHRWGGFGSTNSKKGKSKKGSHWPQSRTAKADIRDSFNSRERKSAVKGPSPPRGNTSPAEVYSDVFLSHARLYVFAEKYDIQILKMLALDELHATLKVYNLYPERTSDIIDLLRYVYCNTSEPSEGVEDLRTLMTQYMGCEMDILTKDEDFKGFMIEDGGAVWNDFMPMVSRVISEAT